MPTSESARAQRQRRKQAIDWLLRNQESDGSEHQARDFAAWLAADARNQAAYDDAQALMGDARTAILGDGRLSSLEDSAQKSTTPAVAAVALLFMGLGIGLFYAFDGPMRLQADVIAGVGEKPTITLADGSTMQLNATSAAAYDFDGPRRVVRLLRGEAFFQVASEPQRPFVVEASGAHTTALGTAFNVRLLDDSTDVTVTEHAVVIATADAQQSPVRLQEGHEVAYSADGHIGAVRAADPVVTLAWRRGQLIVDNATVASVVREIARNFSGRIVIASEGLAQRRVSGTFQVADPDAALDLLRQSLDIEVTRLGPLVIIRG